jgi:hypothetical protein
LKDSHLLAQRMRQLGMWLDAQENMVPHREDCSGPTFGDAYLTSDPLSTSPAASLNHNRLCICGGAGLTREGLDELLGRFARHGIKRFFVWLSPGAEQERVSGWLSATARRVPWTRYPTLRWIAPGAADKPHDFEIRAVDVAAFAAAKSALGGAIFDGYAATLGKPGFQHFIAYDDSRPIAAAALVQFGELGYLTYAGTVESDRRRGAQSALIAHRIAAAQASGCTHIVSQTLTMLEDSFSNLQRAGFREVYEQEVYEFGAD